MGQGAPAPPLLLPSPASTRAHTPCAGDTYSLVAPVAKALEGDASFQNGDESQVDQTASVEHDKLDGAKVRCPPLRHPPPRHPAAAAGGRAHSAQRNAPPTPAPPPLAPQRRSLKRVGPVGLRAGIASQAPLGLA